MRRDTERPAEGTAWRLSYHSRQMSQTPSGGMVPARRSTCRILFPPRPAGVHRSAIGAPVQAMRATATHCRHQSPGSTQRGNRTRHEQLPSSTTKRSPRPASTIGSKPTNCCLKARSGTPEPTHPDSASPLSKRYISGGMEGQVVRRQASCQARSTDHAGAGERRVTQSLPRRSSRLPCSG